jgi:hypothetical protein
MCQENPCLVKIKQKYQAVYVKIEVLFIAVSNIFLHEGAAVQHSDFMLLMATWLTVHTEHILVFLLQHWLHVCTIKLVIHTLPNLFVCLILCNFCHSCSILK